MIYTVDNINTAIEKTFLKDDFFKVKKLLDSYGVEEYEKEKNRVCLAILKLSNGDFLKLNEYVKKSKLDYRDVLLFAEYDEKSNAIENPYADLIENI